MFGIYASVTTARAVMLGLLCVIAAAAVWGVFAINQWRSGPTPETVVAASLEGLREQNVLVPFTARYVAVVTSRQARLGLEAQKTLILPGTVRYELDLAQLTTRDLAWDATARTLTIALPPIRLAGPDIDLDGVREYRDGELLLFFTNAEARLDEANRSAAQTELIAQARGATPLRLARGAAIRAVEANFAMPLRAAGIDARVTARFARE